MTPDALRDLVYRETCPDGCGKASKPDSRGWHYFTDPEKPILKLRCTRNLALAEKVVEAFKDEREALKK